MNEDYKAFAFLIDGQVRYPCFIRPFPMELNQGHLYTIFDGETGKWVNAIYIMGKADLWNKL